MRARGRCCCPSRALATVLLCLAGLAVGSDSDSETVDPKLQEYLELIERYRREGPRQTVPALADWPLERSRSVLVMLANDPDPRCFRRNDAAALLHTEVAFEQRRQGLDHESDEHLDMARLLLGFDPPFRRQWYGSPESESAEHWFERTWLLSVGHNLLSHLPIRALESYKESLKRFGPDLEALLATGTAHELLGFVHSRDAPPPDARSGLLDRQRNDVRRHYRAAEGHYRRALELEPRSAQGHLRLGRVLWYQERVEDARKELAWVIQHSADDRLLGPANLFLGQLEESSGRLAEAVLRYRAALWSDPDSQAATRALAQALHRTGDMTGSARMALSVLRQPSNHPDCWASYHSGYPGWRLRGAMMQLRRAVRP